MPGPTGGRRDRKKDETRQALREAAHRLFAEKGFSRTTIDDIAEAADVSRRTFFRYYDSKDDLLRTDVADLLPVMLAALRRRPAEEPPLAAVLNALRTLIGPDGPPALAESLASPIGGLRARISLIRLLADWEQGIADTLLTRAGIDSPTDADRLRATVTPRCARPPRHTAPATAAPAWRPAASCPSSSRRSPCSSIRAARRGGPAWTLPAPPEAGPVTRGMSRSDAPGSAGARPYGIR
jgi:AcrR family transcriptional regulator